MAQWTNEQLTAINAENASVIVSAAAGSGKTSVLVERLLRQLSDKQDTCRNNDSSYIHKKCGFRDETATFCGAFGTD